MLFMASHVSKRGDIFYFRARVPTHLVRAFGRIVVSLSLHTRDPAEARRRARERRVEFERALAELDTTATPRSSDDWRGSVLYLSDRDIDALCERCRACAAPAREVISATCTPICSAFSARSG